MTTEVLEQPTAASQPGAAAPASPPAQPATAAGEAPAAGATLATSAAPATQQTSDGQPAQPGDKPAANGEQDDKPAVPEAYEFTPPEGVELDAEAVTAFGEVARELGLPQDAAQKVVDKLAPVIAQRQLAQAEAFYSDIGGPPTGWADASKADKEFGGAKLAENLAVAAKAMSLATPEMRALLDKTRLGDHPEMVRWMYRVGKSISEDSFVSGSRDSARPTDPAKRLFPSMN